MSRKLKILQEMNKAARHVNTQKEIRSEQRVVSMCRETDGQTDRRIDRWLLKSRFYRKDKQTNRWTYRETESLMGHNKWVVGGNMCRFDTDRNWTVMTVTVKRGRCISEDHRHEEELNFKACLEMCDCWYSSVCALVWVSVSVLCVCGGGGGRVLDGGFIGLWMCVSSLAINKTAA